MTSRAAANRHRQKADLLDACAVLQEAHQDAQQALREANETGTEAQILAARERLGADAAKVNETRQWLRAEERITRRTAEIGELAAKGRLTGEEQAKLRAWEDDRAHMERIVAPVREALAALGAPVPVDNAPARRRRPGDATVDLPAVKVKTTAHRTGG